MTLPEYVIAAHPHSAIVVAALIRVHSLPRLYELEEEARLAWHAQTMPMQSTYHLWAVDLYGNVRRILP